MSNLNPLGTGANIVTPAPVVHKPGVLPTAAVPVVPVAPVAPVAAMQNLSLNQKVVHEPEKVIEHAPIVEKEILNESTLQVKREHHIQPIIHETERRIQPIIKTEATTERPVIVQDRNVMEAPIVERAALPVGLGAVERVAPEGIIHAPKVERSIVNERPVEVKREHHIQPIIHEREHRIQPIIKTEITAERPILEQDRNVMHAPVVERAPLPAGLEAVERATAEGILHRAKVAKDVIVEHPVQVRHEHHVQPIIHEREHHIQPIIKTQVTAAQTHLKTDKNVMMAPIVERAALPLGLEAVERAGPEGVIHRPKLEKEVIVEHPVQIKHERHIQPIIHEREHHIQPIVKTQVTAEQRVIEQQHTVTLPPIIEPPVMLGARPSPVIATAPIAPPLPPRPAGLMGATATTVLPHTAMATTAVPLATESGLASRSAAPLLGEREIGVGRTGLGHSATGTTGAHGGIGQKIKGAVKEVQGTLTRNPALKEEGRQLLHGGAAPGTTTGFNRPL